MKRGRSAESEDGQQSRLERLKTSLGLVPFIAANTDKTVYFSFPAQEGLEELLPAVRSMLEEALRGDEPQLDIELLERNLCAVPEAEQGWWLITRHRLTDLSDDINKPRVRVGGSAGTLPPRVFRFVIVFPEYWVDLHLVFIHAADGKTARNTEAKV
jgi:hypothetical protein